MVRTAAHVAFEMKDLLPGTQNELSVRNGYGQRWPEECRLQVRMPVPVVPRLLMTVVAAGRNELVQNGGQVMLQSWLELNRTDRRRAPDIENVDCPRLDSGGVHDRGQLLGQVVDIAVSLSGDRNLLLIAHELGRPRRNP